MRIKDFHELAQSKSVLIADKNVLYIFLQSGYENLILSLYENVTTTPKIYESFIKSLDVNSLKKFKKNIKKINFNVSKTAVRSILNESQILTYDEAYAVLCGTRKKVDVILDDPRKVEIFESYGIQTIRPSDIATAASVSLKRNV